MPVEIQEFAQIIEVDGTQREGKAVATNLVAIENPDGGFFFGALKQVTKIHTKITCDNPDCEHGQVDENFHTQPKTLEFDDEGSPDPKFKEDIASVIITSDFTGRKVVFCSLGCLASFSKKAVKEAKLVEMPHGKGKRTFNPEVKPVPVPETPTAIPDGI